MAQKKTRNPLFERLKGGLEEGIEFSKGRLSLRTIEVPDEPPEVDAQTVTELRERIEMTQTVFARVLNVSPKTVQSWEQGLRKPSQASRRLIQIFRERPDVVCEIAGLRTRKIQGIREALDGEGRKKT